MRKGVKTFELKKPLFADKGEGCIPVIIFSLLEINSDFVLAKLPNNKKTDFLLFSLIYFITSFYD